MNNRAFYVRFGKRMLDIIFAVLALPLFLTCLVVVGVAIKIDDGGPVFYKACRRGKDGQGFLMWKFRSMKPNSPDWRNEDKSTFNSATDDRVTRVGHFIRAWSIDEIPQILNVLNGSMSLIGPRPNMNTTPYEELSALEQKRLEMPPGITGPSQANFRNSASTAQKYALDADYVDHVSFVLDLSILFATFGRVLSREGINNDECPTTVAVRS